MTIDEENDLEEEEEEKDSIGEDDQSDDIEDLEDSSESSEYNVKRKNGGNDKKNGAKSVPKSSVSKKKNQFK